MPRKQSHKDGAGSARSPEKRNLAATLSAAAFGLMLFALVASIVWSTMGFDPKKQGPVAHQAELVRECTRLYSRATTPADSAQVDGRYPDGYDRLAVPIGPSCGGLRSRGTLGR